MRKKDSNHSPTAPTGTPEGTGRVGWPKTTRRATLEEARTRPGCATGSDARDIAIDRSRRLRQQSYGAL